MSDSMNFLARIGAMGSDDVADGAEQAYAAEAWYRTSWYRHKDMTEAHMMSAVAFALRVVTVEDRTKIQKACTGCARANDAGPMHEDFKALAKILVECMAKAKVQPPPKTFPEEEALDVRRKRQTDQ